MKGYEIKLTDELEKIMQDEIDRLKLPEEEQQNLLHKMCSEKRWDDAAKSILSGYIVSLIGATERAEQIFGLTYDTVKILPIGLASLFRHQKIFYPLEENVATIGSTIAAYLTFLCMNEHECPMNVRNKYSPLMNEEAVQKLLSESFAGLSVSTGTLEQVDFHEAGMRCVYDHPFSVDGGLFVSMTPAIRAYKKATGIDLAEYGLTNIIIGG